MNEKVARTPDSGIPILTKSDLDFSEKILLWKNGRFYQTELGFAVGVPIGFVYFQGPADALPSDMWPGTTWTDVSAEEANLGRRVLGSLAGSWVSGMPAILSVSVTGGVPTISVVSGGSGYLSGGSGTIPLIVAGTCTTQYVGNATVVNGVITAIPAPGTAGAGYTSGKVAVYDGVYGHGDLVEMHGHSMSPAFDSAGSANNVGPMTQGKTNGNAAGTLSLITMIPNPGYGSIRNGVETTGAYTVAKKWRRTA